MNSPYTIPIILAICVIFIVLFAMKSIKCSKLISENLDLRKQIDKQSKKNSLQFSETVKNPDKKGKTDKSKANTQEKDSPVVSELKEKVRELKADNAKLKEKNFNLSKDNDALRSDARSNSSSNEQDQRELMDLREKNEELTSAAAAAKTKISELEKLVSEAKSQKVESAPVAETSEADAEKIRTLEAEKMSLSASLKDVRGELTNLKRDFKAQVDAAKNEIAESNKALRKDVAAAQRQMAQSKKRADNNHKIYLIARAQMMLAEKRLQTLDPSYKSVMALPTGNEAIEEIIKKFVSMDARESRASLDVVSKDKVISELNEQVKKLQTEIDSMRSAQAISFGALDDSLNFDDDSLSDLVGAVLPGIPAGSDVPSLSGLDAATLADMDFSQMDDDWETI